MLQRSLVVKTLSALARYFSIEFLRQVVDTTISGDSRYPILKTSGSYVCGVGRVAAEGVWKPLGQIGDVALTGEESIRSYDPLRVFKPTKGSTDLSQNLTR